MAAWPQWLAVVLGGGLGSLARWQLGRWLNPTLTAWPLGTLVANVLGGYVIGLAIAAFARQPQLAPEWRLFVITGLLGGLTTFSSFSAEAVDLLERQQFGAAATHLLLHVGGALLATWLGLATGRALAG